MMRDRLRARRDRVLEMVDLGEMLQEYGYAVVPDRHREQQFSCDLHGPDHKPSARYYGTSNTTYCWVCQKKRHALDWVMEKELLDFRGAIEALERRLGLKALPWDDDGYQEPVRPEDELDELAIRRVSYSEERDRMQKFLDGLTRERFDRSVGEEGVSCSTLLSFWEVFDRVDYGMAREEWPESKGIDALNKLRERVLEKVGRIESEKC
jgi:hypothetical protein